MKPAYVARLAERGEYIANGRVYNPEGMASRKIDPAAFSYYNKAAIKPPPVAPATRGKVKAWQHRNRPINQPAFTPAELIEPMAPTGAPGTTTVPIGTPTRR